MDKEFQNEIEPRFGFHLLSCSEGEAEDEERRRVGLLSVGQVGAKHGQLACASSLKNRLFHYNKCNIPTELPVGYKLYTNMLRPAINFTFWKHEPLGHAV